MIAIPTDSGSGNLAREIAQLRERLSDLLAALVPPSTQTPSRIGRLLASDDLRDEPCILPNGSVARVLFLDTLVSRKRLVDEVLQPLSTDGAAHGRLPAAQPAGDDRAIIRRLLDGQVAVVLPQGGAYTVPVQGLAARAVGEPSTDKAIIGPKEGFVERISTNLGLVRRRLKDPRLRVRTYVVGRRSRTRVALVYVDDLAPRRLVRRIKHGLSTISVDFVRTSMDIGEILFGRSWTPFPLSEQTERADRVANALALGRIAFLIDGSPFALLVPVTFLEFQKDSEGALQGPLVVGFVRALRLLGVFAAVMVPGLYVALVSVNVAVLPLPLALALNTARVAVPYPPLTETLIILLMVDILAEATVQAASAVGNTLAIVGTLIIGQMMVQAHLVSTLVLTVTAVTVMGSFMTLRFAFSYGMRIWKYVVVLLAAVGGMVGWFTGLLVLLVHLASLKSAGVPYLAPFGPMNLRDILNYGLVQPPKGSLRHRPRTWAPRDVVRSRTQG